MSDLDTAAAHQPALTEKREQVEAEVTQPLVVITEQQLAFSTAAAVPLPMTKPRRGLIDAVRALFARSSQVAQPTAEHVPPRFYPPRRDEFLEDAAMEREMHRL
ncbi:hypothetical protein Mycsm_05518 [Mycobacterium sp. JS623]|nr:hypothetical protein Mycsm_05518 [Mycobacterium sp. JS623]